MELRRIYLGKDYTIGKLYIDSIYFCDTLEDQVRDLSKEKKVSAETAIPAGTYKVAVTHSPAFKRKLPLLFDVPQFSGIRIHRGNTHVDTAGCILVGENKVVGKVINSTGYELKLTKLIESVTHCEIRIV